MIAATFIDPGRGGQGQKVFWVSARKIIILYVIVFGAFTSSTCGPHDARSRLRPARYRERWKSATAPRPSGGFIGTVINQTDDLVTRPRLRTTAERNSDFIPSAIARKVRTVVQSPRNDEPDTLEGDK